MNIKNIKWSFLSIALGLSIASCTTNLDINVDPNNPTLATAQPNLILPSALQTAANNYNRGVNGDNNFRFASIWMGHAGFSGNFFISQETNDYTLTTSFAQGIWTNMNDNNTDFNLVQSLGVSQNKPFYTGIGKIMQAYNYQTLVDLYNNVPYTEAQKGATVPTPKYDDGKAVYEGILTDVESGASLISGSVAGSVGTDDIMFAGDKTKWLQFANTVKLRMLLRQSEKADRATYIASKVATISGGYLTTNAMINPGYLNSDGKQNGFWRSCHTATGTYAQDLTRGGAYLINTLKALSDPRLSRLFKTNGSGNYVGCQLGANNPANSGTSEFGVGILQGPTQASILLSAAESYFLQAEATLKGWINGGSLATAQSLYEAGVAASFSYLGAGSSTAYVATPGNKQTTWAACNNNTERLALIIRQKHIALNVITPLETYNDYRRLGLPADVTISPLAGTNKIPKRLLFPQREYETNTANVTAQGTINPQSDKIWWMN